MVIKLDKGSCRKKGHCLLIAEVYGICILYIRATVDGSLN